MHYNSFHNKLKTTYLNGKVNRRVDYLLDILLQIEKDQYFQYKFKQQMHPASKKVKIEYQRHAKGLEIPVARVEVRLLHMQCFRKGAIVFLRYCYV